MQAKAREQTNRSHSNNSGNGIISNIQPLTMAGLICWPTFELASLLLRTQTGQSTEIFRWFHLVSAQFPLQPKQIVVNHCIRQHINYRLKSQYNNNDQKFVIKMKLVIKFGRKRKITPFESKMAESIYKRNRKVNRNDSENRK